MQSIYTFPAITVQPFERKKIKKGKKKSKYSWTTYQT